MAAPHSSPILSPLQVTIRQLWQRTRCACYSVPVQDAAIQMGVARNTLGAWLQECKPTLQLATLYAIEAWVVVWEQQQGLG